MGMGEALGHAADLSIDKKIDMPDLNASYIQAKMGLNPIGIIMQPLNATGNGTVTVTGAWTTTINQEGSIIYGKDFIHDGAAGKGTKSVRFTPSASLINAGQYEISVKHKYVNDAGRATNVPVAIQRSGGISNITMSQRFAGTLTNQFQSLGTYTLVGDGSDYVEISTTGTAAGTYVVVDAICFAPVSGVI